ncbi:MAG: hypothetical protein B6I31_03005 [Desulfobacteraceae bacterium 4572_19]|nr:MAG: hypothetical protein B6I31_03005 [Desulfobacteraceae bacterium 4572_19]
MTTFFHRCFFTLVQTLKNSNFKLHIIGKSRRLWLVHFQKEYVENQLSVRQGTCRQCATCCNLLFACPMLTKESLCLVYGICRPQACKVFPIDQRDIDEVALCGGQCAYSFDGKNNKFHLEAETA